MVDHPKPVTEVRCPECCGRGVVTPKAAQRRGDLLMDRDTLYDALDRLCKEGRDGGRASVEAWMEARAALDRARGAA